VKALRQAEIDDLTTANQFLDDVFLPEFILKFEVKPAADDDWHCELTASAELDRRLSIQEPRVINQDWTVRWRNRIVQLACEAADIVQPLQLVTLCEQLDGGLHVFAGDIELSWTRHDPAARKTISSTRPNRLESA